MDDFSLTALFYHVDEFCKQFEKQWDQILVENHPRSSHWWKTRQCRLSLSEIMTIAIWFHSSKYRTFKDFYLYHVQTSLKPFFPKVLSYSRFISLLKSLSFPLFVLQKSLEKASEGIAFIDSTLLSVCHIARASSHRVFKKIARKGKTSVGWFFGLKLHLVVNHQGEIISWMLTPGNVSDLTPVETLCRNLLGKLFGDRAYISQKLFKKLYEQGLQLITRLRSNMKNQLMDLWDKLILHKRSLIESVISQLKLQCQIDHHRHRSPVNFFVNLIGGLIAYSLKEDKPHLQAILAA